MKSFLPILIIVVALLSLSFTNTNPNTGGDGHYTYSGKYSDYNISTIYLRMFNNVPFKVSLNGTSYGNVESLHVLNGLRPGKYMLKVTVPFTESLKDYAIVQNGKEQVLFYDYIEIKPKQIIHAKINKENKFTIIGQQKTTTVCAPYTAYSTEISI